jgi:hypothetical protein
MTVRENWQDDSRLYLEMTYLVLPYRTAIETTKPGI